MLIFALGRRGDDWVCVGLVMVGHRNSWTYEACDCKRDYAFCVLYRKCGGDIYVAGAL